MGLVSTSAMSMVSFDLQDTSTHSMNAVRLFRGPSPDNCSCVEMFSPVRKKRAAVRVAHVIRQENEILGVVFERAVPLLQQEDENSKITHNKKINKN